MKSRAGLLTILLVLAFLGIADAWYLTMSAFAGASLVCDIGTALDGCNIVAQSPYSRLFGLPLALYGAVFYMLTFALVAVLFVRTHRPLYQAVAVLGVVGFLASLAFLAIQLIFIKALCTYCIVSAVIAGLICILALVLWRRHAPLQVGRAPVPPVLS